MAVVAVDVRQLPQTTTHVVARGAGYFPVIAHLGGESLAVVVRAGAAHIGLGGRLDVVLSADGGKTWGSPVCAAASDKDDRNPALGAAQDGSLVLAYVHQAGYDASGALDPSKECAETCVRSVLSTDGGQSWQGDAPVHHTQCDKQPLTGSPFGKIRCAADGTMYMPFYTELGVGQRPSGWLTPTAEMIDRSVGSAADDGRAAPQGPVPLDGAADDRDSGAHTGTPCYLLQSRDNGRSWCTWGPILVGMRMNESDVLMLSESEWLWAGRGDDEATYSCRSEDGGRTWRGLQRLTRDRNGGKTLPRGEHPPVRCALTSESNSATPTYIPSLTREYIPRWMG